MKCIVKHFKNLAVDELWEIYLIRSKVFVVEQDCVYQDVDEYDKVSYHVMLVDDDGLQAYARVIPANQRYEEVSIGRVISMKRGCGLGLELMRQAIKTACEKFNAEEIVLGGQVYAIPFYEKAGFKTFGEEYSEDGIPHMHMRWKKEDRICRVN